MAMFHSMTDQELGDVVAAVEKVVGLYPTSRSG